MVSSVEQVAIVGSAWSTAGIKQGGGKTFEGRTARVWKGRSLEGVDYRRVGNPRYLGPFPL